MSDSPIEARWLHALQPRLAADCTIDAEVEVHTHRGLFRLDFVVRSPAGDVAFECDGKEFHGSGRRDEWRDACILGDGFVPTIYRLRGQDINFRLYDVLLVVARWNPELFSDRARNVIESETSGNAAQWMNERCDDTIARIPYDTNAYILVERRGTYQPTHAFWRYAYGESLKYGPMSLDEMLARYEADHPWPTGAKP